MSYLNESKLSAYDNKLKEWVSSQESKTITSSIYPWAKTVKAGIVSCYPVGGTELKSVVDFIFTETPPTSGDKGPDNPSTINGVTSVDVGQCGENICVSIPQLSLISSLGDGWYGGTVDNSSGLSAKYPGVFFPFLRNIDNTKPYCVVVEVENCDEFAIGTQHNVYPAALVTTSPAPRVSGTGKFKFDLNRASTSKPLYIIRNDIPIPAGETKTFKLRVAVLQCYASEVNLDTYVYTNLNNSYSVSLGSTYYGGSIDLVTGVMTVTHVAVMPDASTVDISSAPAVLPLDYADTFGRTITSTDGTSLSVGSAGGTVVYKLATPQTVQLNPVSISALSQPDKYTSRLNTVYTDASAVQVGYVKSPIREEYELTQAIVAQGG